jgi:glycosyltransferase involved in cell wall biosynthesis
MHLGFYYHILAAEKQGRIWLPSYLGLFLDSLAAQVQTLTVFLHEAKEESEKNACNYALHSPNILWANLGQKKPAWHRTLFGAGLLRQFRPDAAACDVLLVRAPSPLAPAFFKVFGKKTPIAYLLVGDYLAGVPHLKTSSLRKWGIYAMAVYLDRAMKNAARHCCVLSNSQDIINEFKPFSKETHPVRTTTLREEDFFEKTDTCPTPPYRVLFVGRFDFAKGLRELLDACATLSAKGVPLELHLAGWEESPEKPVAAWLEQRASDVGFGQNLYNHGKKNHGEDINALYRMADIFVMPSYHEGFPRAIWEAMANSLPVIATTVGAIPHNLRDGHSALLIPPKNTRAIAEKIEALIENPTLRKSLIANGLETAKETTLDAQSIKLLEILGRFSHIVTKQ